MRHLLTHVHSDLQCDPTRGTVHVDTTPSPPSTVLSPGDKGWGSLNGEVSAVVTDTTFSHPPILQYAGVDPGRGRPSESEVRDWCEDGRAGGTSRSRIGSYRLEVRKRVRWWRRRYEKGTRNDTLERGPRRPGRRVDRGGLGGHRMDGQRKCREECETLSHDSSLKGLLSSVRVEE